MISEKDISIIEDFLRGNLSNEERKTVEERMDTEPNFAQQVQLLRNLPVAIQTDVSGFREDLNSIIREDIGKEMAVGRGFLQRKWLVAASIAVLLGLFWIFFPRSSTQDLYASHFEIPAENLSVRNNETMDINLQSALTFYNDQDFVSAEMSFNRFLADSPDRIDVVFFKGVSLMMQNKHDQARIALDRVITASTNFSNSAIWYKGLSLLADGDHDAAKETMRILAKEGNNRYADRAQRIIDKIR